ncbi:putative F-box protein At5g15660 [Rutidosis leptorrhynchoides]|uniref:putative F-box protein At5g15660 n=1 Tax=Rutidosis leptorrhynchoides TaxID=125765 RepID=UPI003A9A17D5
MSKRNPDDNLQSLHIVLYNKRANLNTLKKNIGMFSGFVWTDDEEKQRTKVKERLDKLTIKKLFDFCDLLNLQINKSSLTKEEVSLKLLEFLQSPHVTTEVLLPEKEQKRESKDNSAKRGDLKKLKSESSPVKPIERPSRERKTVERYTQSMSRLSSPKPLSIGKGSSTRLKIILNVKKVHDVKSATTKSNKKSSTLASKKGVAESSKKSKEEKKRKKVETKVPTKKESAKDQGEGKTTKEAKTDADIDSHSELPIEIQIEIIKRLPIKSLIQCTLISKSFNNIIKSPKFINDHSVRHNQQHHILIRYETETDAESPIYVSIIDVENFPRNKWCITSPNSSFVLGSSSGLICIYDHENIDEKCVICNPFIQRRVDVSIPNAFHTVVGFGVSRDTCDPKLVNLWRCCDSTTHSNKVNWDAQVYSVSSGVWRTVPSNKHRISVHLEFDQVELNGVIYFVALRRTVNGGDRYMINTFDLTTEKLDEVDDLPDSLAKRDGHLGLSKRMESLALIKKYKEGNQKVFDVWILKHGAPNSYEKVFTYKAPMGSADFVEGFTKNGEPILLTSSPSKGDRYEVYNPCLEHFTDLEVFEDYYSMMEVSVHSYTKTLLLIDQPNTILINGDDGKK